MHGGISATAQESPGEPELLPSGVELSSGPPVPILAAGAREYASRFLLISKGIAPMVLAHHFLPSF
jgi:hypothetical protein